MELRPRIMRYGSNTEHYLRHNWGKNIVELAVVKRTIIVAT